MYASVCQSVGDVTWPAAGDPQVCYSLLQTPVRRTHAVALQSPVIKHLVCVHLQFQSLRFYARLSYDKSVSLSVCLSVSHILVLCRNCCMYRQTVSPPGSAIILVFLVQGIAKFRPLSTNEGVKNKYDGKNFALSDQYRRLCCKRHETDP